MRFAGRQLGGGLWRAFVLAMLFAASVHAATCRTEILKYAELEAAIGAGKTGADGLLQSKPMTLAEALAALTEQEHLSLSQRFPEAFAYFHQNLLKKLLAPTPEDVTESFKIEDTWSRWLVMESLQSPLQSGIRDHLKLPPVEMTGPSTLSPEHQSLRGRHWVDSQTVPILWGPVFAHLEWLNRAGCSREQPVEAWIAKKSCLGTVRSLYGALTEAWLLSPQDGIIPGGAIRVNGKHHADGWRVSREGENLILESLIEIKPSVVRFHAKGMYQIHGFLERLLTDGARVEIYGHSLPLDKLRIRTKDKLVTIKELRAVLGPEHFQKRGIELANGEAPTVSYDGRWPAFVHAFNEVFHPEFFEAVMPKDEVPFVASHLVHLPNKPVGIQTPGLLTLSQNRERFIQFMASIYADPGTEPLLARAIFLKETQEHRDLIVHVVLPGTSNAIAEPTPLARANLDPRLLALDYAAILKEARHRDNSYSALDYPAHAEKKEFLEKVLLPYAQWRAILAAPGVYREIHCPQDRLRIEAHGAMMPLEIVWEPRSKLSEPVWQRRGKTYTLRVPEGFEWPTDEAGVERVQEFFTKGLKHHDLQKYTVTDWIERQRAGLGLKRLLLKKGQKLILDKLEKHCEETPDERLEAYVQGPTAYGKTVILYEALKKLIRRVNTSTPRNLFFVVTGQKKLVEQISKELKKDRTNDISEPVDFHHLSWETGASRKQFESIAEVLEAAKKQGQDGRAVVVTVNWSYLNERVKKASGKELEQLREVLRGFFIDETDQAGSDANLDTAMRITDQVPGIVLWGQEAVAGNRDVIEQLFHGNVWFVYEDLLEDKDPISASIYQTLIAMERGEIGGFVQQDNDHMFLHFTPEDLLKECGEKFNIDPRLIYKTIKDDDTREKLYGCFARAIDGVMQRNNGIIRVEYQQQAADLAQFLQRYSDEASEVDPTRRKIVIKPYFDGSKDHDAVYEGLSLPGAEKTVHWAVAVKQFDGGLDIADLSGAVMLVENADAEVTAEFYGRLLRLFPGKEDAEFVQVSDKPSYPDGMIAGLAKKVERVSLRGSGSGSRLHPIVDPPPLIEDRVITNVPDAPSSEVLAAIEARHQLTFFTQEQIRISHPEDYEFWKAFAEASVDIHFQKTETEIAADAMLRKAANDNGWDYHLRADLSPLEKRILMLQHLSMVSPELNRVVVNTTREVSPKVVSLGIREGGIEKARAQLAGKSAISPGWPVSDERAAEIMRALRANWPAGWSPLSTQDRFVDLMETLAALMLRGQILLAQSDRIEERLSRAVIDANQQEANNELTQRSYESLIELLKIFLIVFPGDEWFESILEHQQSFQSAQESMQQGSPFLPLAFIPTVLVRYGLRSAPSGPAGADLSAFGGIDGAFQSLHVDIQKLEASVAARKGSEKRLTRAQLDAIRSRWSKLIAFEQSGSASEVLEQLRVVRSDLKEYATGVDPFLFRDLEKIPVEPIPQTAITEAPGNSGKRTYYHHPGTLKSLKDREPGVLTVLMHQVALYGFPDFSAWVKQMVREHSSDKSEQQQFWKAWISAEAVRLELLAHEFEAIGTGPVTHILRRTRNILSKLTPEELAIANIDNVIFKFTAMSSEVALFVPTVLEMVSSRWNPEVTVPEDVIPLLKTFAPLIGPELIKPLSVAMRRSASVPDDWEDRTFELVLPPAEQKHSDWPMTEELAKRYLALDGAIRVEAKSGSAIEQYAAAVAQIQLKMISVAIDAARLSTHLESADLLARNQHIAEKLAKDARFVFEQMAMLLPGDPWFEGTVKVQERFQKVPMVAGSADAILGLMRQYEARLKALYPGFFGAERVRVLNEYRNPQFLMSISALTRDELKNVAKDLRLHLRDVEKTLGARRSGERGLVRADQWGTTLQRINALSKRAPELGDRPFQAVREYLKSLEASLESYQNLKEPLTVEKELAVDPPTVEELLRVGSEPIVEVLKQLKELVATTESPGSKVLEVMESLEQLSMEANGLFETVRDHMNPSGAVRSTFFSDVRKMYDGPSSAAFDPQVEVKQFAIRAALPTLDQIGKVPDSVIAAKTREIIGPQVSQFAQAFPVSHDVALARALKACEKNRNLPFCSGAVTGTTFMSLIRYVQAETKTISLQYQKLLSVVTRMTPALANSSTILPAIGRAELQLKAMVELCSVLFDPDPFFESLSQLTPQTNARSRLLQLGATIAAVDGRIGEVYPSLKATFIASLSVQFANHAIEQGLPAGFMEQFEKDRSTLRGLVANERPGSMSREEKMNALDRLQFFHQHERLIPRMESWPENSIFATALTEMDAFAAAFEFYSDFNKTISQEFGVELTQDIDPLAIMVQAPLVEKATTENVVAELDSRQITVNKLDALFEKANVQRVPADQVTAILDELVSLRDEFTRIVDNSTADWFNGLISDAWLKKLRLERKDGEFVARELALLRIKVRARIPTMGKVDPNLSYFVGYEQFNLKEKFPITLDEAVARMRLACAGFPEWDVCKQKPYNASSFANLLSHVALRVQVLGLDATRLRTSWSPEEGRANPDRWKHTAALSDAEELLGKLRRALHVLIPDDPMFATDFKSKPLKALARDQARSEELEVLTGSLSIRLLSLYPFIEGTMDNTFEYGMTLNILKKPDRKTYIANAETAVGKLRELKNSVSANRLTGPQKIEKLKALKFLDVYEFSFYEPESEEFFGRLHASVSLVVMLFNQHIHPTKLLEPELLYQLHEGSTVDPAAVVR